MASPSPQPLVLPWPKKSARTQHPTNGQDARKTVARKQTAIELKVNRTFPAGQLGVLSNHFVVQNDGPEFHLLFFQAHLPIILEESEEEKAREMATSSTGWRSGYVHSTHYRCRGAHACLSFKRCRPILRNTKCRRGCKVARKNKATIPVNPVDRVDPALSYERRSANASESESAAFSPATSCSESTHRQQPMASNSSVFEQLMSISKPTVMPPK